jgi:hypothetical protein
VASDGLAESKSDGIGVCAASWHARKEIGNRPQNELDMSMVHEVLCRWDRPFRSYDRHTGTGLAGRNCIVRRPAMDWPLATGDLKCGRRSEDRQLPLTPR